MFRQAVLAITPILLTAIPHSEESEREGRILGFSNPFGFYGHEACVSDLLIGKEHRVGECYNEIECVAGGGIIGGYCGAAVAGTGVCCVHTNHGRSGLSSSSKLGYFYNNEWPRKGSGSQISTFTVKPRDDTCFVRFELLTLELEVESDNCVHDRLTIMGGKDMSGAMCGDRSGEVTIMEVEEGRDITIAVQVQSEKWRWNIGISQISCQDVKDAKARTMKSYDNKCGKKNPSLQNKIGDLEKDPDRRKKKPEIKLPRKSARTVFKELEKLPKLTEFEKKQLQIYKPSFTKQVLDYSKFDLPGLGRSSLQKGRILYGNETDVNEYPWQISMWIDRSHFCGGTLITDQWVATAAHCVDLHYRRHFSRITVSLGDHDVKIFDESKNVFRKIRRIIRFPMYDNNYINGDMALLQLADKVEFSERISPACLPYDPEEKFSFSEGLITGWGYTEKTKIMKPRPMTSEVLREAEVFILPQDLCEKYSPFPITEKMICTFKGPLGVETTCQGDSGGPLVVDMGENKHVLVGATSFGVSTCEGPYPSMFTRITEHLGFIFAAMVPAPMEYMNQDYKTPFIVGD